MGRGIRAQGARERPDSQTGSPPTWCHQRSERHSPDHAARRARLPHQCRHGLGARMRPASYVRSSPHARITTCFSADEPWQTSHGPLLVTYLSATAHGLNHSIGARRPISVIRDCVDGTKDVSRASLLERVDGRVSTKRQSRPIDGIGAAPERVLPIPLLGSAAAV